MESVKIGDQIWSLENSTIKKFSNGENIHQCTTKEDWEECGLIEKPAWCYYDFDEKNEKIQVVEKNGNVKKINYFHCMDNLYFLCYSVYFI